MIGLKRIEKELPPRGKHYDAEMRLRIIGMFKSPNVDRKAVLKMFDITEPTLYNWCHAFDENGLAGLESAPHSGRKPLITTDELMACIMDINKDNLIVTTRCLQKVIFDKHNVNYSMRGLQDMLKRNHITRKKIEPVHRHAASNQQAGTWQRHNIPKIERCQKEGYALMSQDEAHPTLDSTARHGYSTIGERIYARYEGKKQSISVFGGVTEDRRSVFRTYRRCNTDTMIDYLKAVKRQIGKTVIICDGATYHRSKRLHNWLAKNPEIVLMILPTGSPHMNVVELEWNRLRSHLDDFVFEDKATFVRTISNFTRNKICIYSVKHKLYSKLAPHIIG